MAGYETRLLWAVKEVLMAMDHAEAMRAAFGEEPRFSEEQLELAFDSLTGLLTEDEQADLVHWVSDRNLTQAHRAEIRETDAELHQELLTHLRDGEPYWELYRRLPPHLQAHMRRIPGMICTKGEWYRRQVFVYWLSHAPQWLQRRFRLPRFVTWSKAQRQAFSRWKELDSPPDGTEDP
jgi:hypothetical protein